MSAQDKKGFKFFIKGVRCFKEEAEFNIRPLTFLTGENSTGKAMSFQTSGRNTDGIRLLR